MLMPVDLRDQIWQFIGVVFSVVAILISLYMFAAQRKRKSLVSDIIDYFSFLSLKGISQEKFHITYGDEQVHNLYILVLKIWNDGDVPILQSDFTEPLRVYICGEIKILEVGTLETVPLNLNPQISIAENACVISPLLLNKGDSILLKFILSEGSTASTFSGVDIFSRIAGINQVASKPIYNKPIQMSGIFFALTGISIFIYLQTINSEPFSNIYLLVTQLLAMTLIVAGQLILYLPIYRWKKKEKSLKKYHIYTSFNE
jgi:hypothetical protein